MKDGFWQLAEKRRSIYALGQEKVLTEDEVISLVQNMVKQCPTAFNSQSGRVVVLFGGQNQRLWNMVKDCLREKVPAEAFAKTEEKINSFAAGFATVLYFIDDEVTKDLQKKYPLYAENFPIWAEQANGMLQYMVWTALAEQNVGASLQHYNPLIDEKLREIWNLPKSWRLRAQMPMGSIETAAGEKTYLPLEKRVLIFK